MMIQYQGILFIRCATGMLPGSGEGHDFIDRAVQRNTVSGAPYLQGSSKKGSLSSVARLRAIREQEALFEALFGKEGKSGHQGCYPASDAEVLLFPVASLRGGFAWVASVLGLAGFASMLRDAPVDGLNGFAETIDTLFARQWTEGMCLFTPNAPLTIRDRNNGPAHLALNGLVLNGKEEKSLESIAATLAERIYPDNKAMRSLMEARILIVGNETFRMLINTGMQKEASIQILPTGVTKRASLRYSEYIPAQAVLSSLECVKPPRSSGVDQKAAWNALRALFGEPKSPALHRFGADETTGKGLAHTLFWASGAAHPGADDAVSAGES